MMPPAGSPHAHAAALRRLCQPTGACAVRLPRILPHPGRDFFPKLLLENAIEVAGILDFDDRPVFAGTQ
jgi:hypothetical protein